VLLTFVTLAMLLFSFSAHRTERREVEVVLVTLTLPTFPLVMTHPMILHPLPHRLTMTVVTGAARAPITKDRIQLYPKVNRKTSRQRALMTKTSSTGLPQERLGMSTGKASASHRSRTMIRVIQHLQQLLKPRKTTIRVASHFLANGLTLGRVTTK